MFLPGVATDIGSFNPTSHSISGEEQTMKRQHFIRTLSGLFSAAIVGLAGTGTVQGQFTQNRHHKN
jgi:hypothetical protein